MLKGERLSFDDESRALYDAVAPTHPESHFKAILDQLEKRFPGTGPLVARYDAWRRPFIIPRERLDSVFTAAIDACRSRTREHVPLPSDEHFTVEYVTDKSCARTATRVRVPNAVGAGRYRNALLRRAYHP